MAPALDPMVGRYLRLQIDGVDHRVYFEEAGPKDGGGIPLICLHTAGADGRQYRHLLAILQSPRAFACSPLTCPGMASRRRPMAGRRRSIA